MLNYSYFSHLSSWSFNLSLKIEFDLSIFSLLFNFALSTSIVGKLFDHLQQWIKKYFVNSITNSMISNGHSLTFVINTIFAIFNSIGISKFLLTMFLPDSKTVLLQGKARDNEELSQCHFYKSYKGPNSLSQF